MLALLLTLIAADPPPSVLRIQASEPGAELSVRADAPGWSGAACPAPVTTDRPCEIAPAPARQFVDLRVSGTRSFANTVLVGPWPTTVRIVHHGYARTAAGLVMVAAAVAIIAAGVSSLDAGDEPAGQRLIAVGASVEAVGLILVFNDLMRIHDRAVVVE